MDLSRLLVLNRKFLRAAVEVRSRRFGAKDSSFILTYSKKYLEKSKNSALKVIALVYYSFE